MDFILYRKQIMYKGCLQNLLLNDQLKFDMFHNSTFTTGQKNACFFHTSKPLGLTCFLVT